VIPRPKLPAYGNALLKARRAGMHPSVVTVVYGNDWNVPGTSPRLAVQPGDALGRDWRCVAGLPVNFLNRDPSGRSVFDGAATEALQLVAELALDSAHIAIEEHGNRCQADVLAFLQRRWDGERMVWPAWWSEEIEKLHGRNRQRWISEAEAYLARLAA
jgi:hypothetical protein